VLQVPLVEPALTAPHSVVRASALDADSLLDDWAEAQIVFQPIVELERGEIVGYEALARFADGPNIELRLAQAFSAGRGPSLESRLARAALRAASRLPKPAWVAVKASPTVIGNDPRLLAVLQETSRPVVLEVAESEAAEIARLTLDPVSSRTTGSVVPEGPPRAASRLLTPANTSIAIEHAAGGNRTVRLMQQVRPRYVKLDRSVCRRLPGDSVRQAQLQILLQAAGAIRTTIVATGIETEAERSTLIALGVSLGQGYLLGQPRSLVDA
jgi:EAL domain-containing protein (putative c-di-GMP-specific phosphodiesterase class I)